MTVYLDRAGAPRRPRVPGPRGSFCEACKRRVGPELDARDLIAVNYAGQITPTCRRCLDELAAATKDTAADCFRCRRIRESVLAVLLADMLHVPQQSQPVPWSPHARGCKRTNL